MRESWSSILRGTLLRGIEWDVDSLWEKILHLYILVNFSQVCKFRFYVVVHDQMTLKSYISSLPNNTKVSNLKPLFFFAFPSCVHKEGVSLTVAYASHSFRQ